MNVLLTGAFGNIGQSALHELVEQGHTVRCFDLKTGVNEGIASRLSVRYGDQMQIAWGDLRRPADTASAVRDQDVIVHMAFIIPKMSATGIESESQPELARAVNVGGTRSLLDAARAASRPLRFLSSYHVYGLTQHLPPPRMVSDPVQPVEHYARHKVECEQMTRESGLEWGIFRLCAALPLALRLNPGMFDVPLDNRMEFVHTRDAGLAIANGVSHPAIWGRILHIGGGPRCQYIFREIVSRVLGAVGVGMLPEQAFNTAPFATDWVDTTESQALLRYQTRDLGDYVRDMQALMEFRLRLARIARGLARRWLLRQSPYYHPASALGALV